MLCETNVLQPLTEETVRLRMTITDNKPYSMTLCWLCAYLNSSVLCSAVMTIRGSCSSGPHEYMYVVVVINVVVAIHVVSSIVTSQPCSLYPFSDRPLDLFHTHH